MEKQRQTALNLGCGTVHKSSSDKTHYINIDWVEPADVVCDVTEGLPFEDQTVSRIEADNLFEHFNNDQFKFVLNECHRVMKPGGILWFKVPDALHWMDGAFGDPTHQRYFVPRSFYYFTDTPTYHNYGKSYGFKMWKQRLLETDNKFFTCELER